MAEAEVMLKITKREPLPFITFGTDIIQTDDGTVFYYSTDFPHQRLYVKSCGKEIDANLPDDRIGIPLAHGNAIYFKSNTKFYKAVFSLSDGITISYLRDRVNGEAFLHFGICARMINEKKCVYRWCDDPNEDGIPIHYYDFSEEIERMDLEDIKRLELKGVHRAKRGEKLNLSVRCIHRGTVINCVTRYRSTPFPPSVRKSGENSIIIEGIAALQTSCYAADATPFIYMSHDYDCFKYLHILDTTSMTFLPPVQIGGVIGYVAGVHNGEITVKEGGYAKASYLVTAQLPWESVRKYTKSTQREGPCCVVCLDKVPNIILYDCKHVVVCEDCFNQGSRDPSTALKNCPICRNYIKRTGKVFL